MKIQFECTVPAQADAAKADMKRNALEIDAVKDDFFFTSIGMFLTETLPSMILRSGHLICAAAVLSV